MVNKTLDIFCPSCGYNLRGIPQWRCPECAFHYDHAAIRSVGSSEASRRDVENRRILGWAVFGAALATSPITVSYGFDLFSRFVLVAASLLTAMLVRQFLRIPRPPGIMDGASVQCLIVCALLAPAGILALTPMFSGMLAVVLVTRAWILFVTRTPIRPYGGLIFPRADQQILMVDEIAADVTVAGASLVQLMWMF